MMLSSLSKRIFAVALLAFVSLVVAAYSASNRIEALRDDTARLMELHTAARALASEVAATIESGTEQEQLQEQGRALRRQLLMLSQIAPGLLAAEDPLEALLDVASGGVQKLEEPISVPALAAARHASDLRSILLDETYAVRKDLQDTTRTLLISLTALLGLFVLLGGAAGLLLGRRVIQPLRLLHGAIEESRSGSISMLPETPHNDEIGAAITAFNKLAIERNRQAEELARQKELIGMAGEVARFGGWRYNAQKRRLRWSDEVGPIVDQPTGYTPDLKMSLNYFVGTDRSRASNMLEQCLTDGTPYDGVFELRTATGRQIWARAVGHPYRSSDGRIIGAFGAFQDVTELQTIRIQEEMQRRIAAEAQKNESIGRLTGGVAHDFNNLLAVIIGNLEFLEADLGLDDSDDRAQMLKSAQRAAARGADLTRNMLAFARKAPLQPQELNLNESVSSTERLAARTLPATIKVDCSLVAGLWKVKADRASIESALLNLMVNAAHAMPKGGRITLETQNLRIEDDYIQDSGEDIPKGRYAMVAVSDTGCGIAPDILDKIFEPFFTTKGLTGGSGLGLSMVDGFVKQSGGFVRVYSEIDVGTTFKLFFPALDATEEPEQQKENEAQQSYEDQTARVLLVEDQLDVLEALKRTLSRAGHVVTTAVTGDQAVEVFDGGSNFDVLVTDIVMPGKLQGPDLARLLRRDRPDLPVVFLSGYASESMVHGNGLKPSDIRLMKPVQSNQFLSAINSALKRTT